MGNKGRRTIMGGGELVGRGKDRSPNFIVR